MSKTIISSAKKCELNLKTPYDNITTDRYLCFLKAKGRNYIECNGLDIDQIRKFRDELNKLLLKYGDEIENGIDTNK